MNISLDAKALCLDGYYGNLDHVILKSANEEITHLVIRDEKDQGTEYLVPINLVSKSNHERIQLNCTRDELKSMPIFNKEEYIPRSVFNYQIKPYLLTTHAVIPGRYVPIKVEQIPAGERAIKMGASVEAKDGQVGFVDEFLIDPDDNCLSHLILRQGHLWGQEDITIPVDQVERLEEDTVHLKISKTEVESLPTIPVHRFWIKKTKN
jgi:sporulation protein YlmC with PRC-barrel domain